MIEWLLPSKELIYPVYWYENAFSDDSIKIIEEAAKQAKKEEGLINSSNNKQEVQDDIRKSNVKWLHSNIDGMQEIYRKCVTYVNSANADNFCLSLIGMETLQYTEYDSSYSGFYVKHIDASLALTDPLKNRELSFSIQLSEPDEYEGGELIIYSGSDEIVAPKSKGTIVFFNSYVTHEVTPVTSGTRKSLVSWVHRR